MREYAQALAIALSGANRAHRAAPAAPAARPLLRDELRPRLRPRVRAGDGRRRRRDRLGECVADANPYYSAETTRTAWHIIASSSRRSCSDATFAHPREVFGALARDARPPHGQGGRRDGGVGSLRAAAGRQPVARVLGGTRDRRSRPASRSGSRIRSTSSSSASRSSGPPATAGSRSRSSRAGTSRRSSASATRFGDIPLMVDANAAYTLADAAHLAELDRFELMMIEQPLDYDDIRDHARLQARIRDADLPRRVDPHGARARRRRSRSAPAGSSTSSRGGSAATRESIRAPRSWPRRTAFRSGTAACSRAASAAPTTSTCRRCRTSRCRATSPPAGATSRPI